MPRLVRGVDAIGLVPIPGPVDELLLVLISPVFLILYREPMRDAWARASPPPGSR